MPDLHSLAVCGYNGKRATWLRQAMGLTPLRYFIDITYVLSQARQRPQLAKLRGQLFTYLSDFSVGAELAR